MKLPMKHGTFLLALGILLSTNPAWAQQAAAGANGPKPIEYKDWSVLCEKAADGKENCQMFQNIGLNVGKNEEGKDITLRMQVKLGFIPGQKDAVLLMTLPLGVALPPGVEFQVDAGEPTRVPFEICDPVGCRAGFPVDSSFVAGLKKGKTAKVTFAIQRQAGSVPVSLTGFTKAYNHVAQNKP